MPRNRVQHQKGLSDDGFEQRYPDEEACRQAWFAWRWPEGFKCPRCAWTKYSEIQGRQLLQCGRCRYQTSLIASTVLQGTKLPMRVWFRAMHLLGQGKKGISNIELGRRLGISTNAAWRLQHKLMQAMLERDRRYKLGAAGPRIEIDDAYIGGERTGEGSQLGAPPGLPLGEHGAGQCQEQPLGHPSRGRRQTSATVPRCLRLALQPPLCFKNHPRAARYRRNHHPANALPPSQTGRDSMINGTRFMRIDS
jgi:hypothetical protein